MKVLHLTTAHPPRDNRIFNKEATALAERGIDITLAAKENGSQSVNGVKMVELPSLKGRLQRFILGPVAAWRALDQQRPNLVHVHDPELIPMAVLWARTHRSGFVYDAHEDLVGQIEDKAYLSPRMKAVARLYAHLILGLADRAADGIVAATPVIAAKYRNKNLAVVRNYPWLRDYPVIERHEVPGRVVYVGALTKGRESDVMIETIKAVEESSMVMAGRPDAYTQKLIDALRPEDRIDFKGPVTPAEIPGILATGAVGFVFLEPLPNYKESLPTKLFEYMAAGIPFIASDFPYWRDLLDEFDAGIFVDTSSPEAPAAALRELLADPERRRAMGERGRKAIEEHFNFEADVDALVELSRTAAH